MQIFKYQLPIGAAVPVLRMPSGGRVLTVQLQHGVITLWAEVEPEAPRVSRTFRIVGTGQAFDPTGLDYVGTVQAESGLVWHVYEEPAF